MGFFLRPIVYCLTSFCTPEGTRLDFFFQRGFIFQHTFVRELLLGNVLFKTEIFVQTWSVIIGCANFEENNWEHLWRSLRSDFSSVIHFPHAMLTCQSFVVFFFFHLSSSNPSLENNLSRNQNVCIECLQHWLHFKNP